MPTAATQRAPDFDSRTATGDLVPTKRDLTSWWKQFKKPKREDEKVVDSTPNPQGIFGVPLHISIRYANVAISLFDANGRSFIYGYVPIVVAKCGVFLKEKATDVEGIFRLAGAERRIKELQSVFNSPDRYGKGLDWTGYTVHDASNVLRRYINQLPEPIVPLEFYARFREPLRHHQAQAVGESSGQAEDIGDFDLDNAIRTYQQLITELPPLNRQLLLYLLDLLAVFAAKSDVNLMTAHNLSSIFQPGLIHDPMHNLSPTEYRLSQDVLIFLIEKQDHFLVGMQGTAVDEKTIQEVQSGTPSPQRPPSVPTTPKGRTQKLIGRSASTASAASESARRLGAIRRNQSVSSRHSRQSNGFSGADTPPSGSGAVSAGMSAGVHRSNTVPLKKSPSPALGSERFAQIGGAISPPAIGKISPGPTPLASVSEMPSNPATFFGPSPPTAPIHVSQQQPVQPTATSQRQTSQERQTFPNDAMQLEMPPAIGIEKPQGSGTPPRERSMASLFRNALIPEADKKDGRKPNKLQKKRVPESLISPGSSTHSLAIVSNPNSPTYPPYAPSSRHGSQSIYDPQPLEGMRRPPNIHREQRGETRSPDRLSARYVTAQSSPDGSTLLEKHVQPMQVDTGRNPSLSPTGSLTSSGNDDSSRDNADPDEREKNLSKHRHWRLSSPGKSEQRQMNGAALAPSSLGSLPQGAERSTSTVESTGRSRKSLTDDSYTTNTLAKPRSSQEADERTSSTASSDRKGPLNWFRDRLGRSKSPVSRSAGGDKQSLNAVAAGQEPLHGRGKSVEAFGELQKDESKT